MTHHARRTKLAFYDRERLYLTAQKVVAFLFNGFFVIVVVKSPNGQAALFTIVSEMMSHTFAIGVRSTFLTGHRNWTKAA